MTDPNVAGLLFATNLCRHPHEVFAAAVLDSRHQLLAYEELFRGTVDGAEIHPRIVAQRALTLNASAVIVGHNHPSGNPEPSAADRAVTARLKQALALLDVRLLDHFVVAGNQHRSLASLGYC
jgi:DNA repair protein RadC